MFRIMTFPIKNYKSVLNHIKETGLDHYVDEINDKEAKLTIRGNKKYFDRLYDLTVRI